MRKIIPAKLESARVRDGPHRTGPLDGTRGAFLLYGPSGMNLVILSSGEADGTGWEHVSVSGKNRCPNWIEMCFVKDLFWGEDEVVMQLHPAKQDYVNQHPYCLHLWKPTADPIPLPPSILVGFVSPSTA